MGDRDIVIEIGRDDIEEGFDRLEEALSEERYDDVESTIYDTLDREIEARDLDYSSEVRERVASIIATTVAQTYEQLREVDEGDAERYLEGQRGWKGSHPIRRLFGRLQE